MGSYAFYRACDYRRKESRKHKVLAVAEEVLDMSGTLECMRCLRVYPKGMDHCPNCTPTEKPHKAQAPRSVSEFKPGDRVKIYSPSNQLLMYEGLQRGATGTVRRLIAGMVRVEIDGTGSQDSEGHNSYSDFIPSELTKIPACGSENTKVSRGPVSKYNAFNQPTPTEKPQGAGAVPPGITVRFDDKGIHIVATAGNECFEMGRKYHYIPEARHKELMERAVGEERLMSRIFALKDAKRNPAILDAMIESADRDIREYLKAAISTGEKA